MYRGGFIPSYFVDSQSLQWWFKHRSEEAIFVNTRMEDIWRRLLFPLSLDARCWIMDANAMPHVKGYESREKVVRKK